MKCTACEQPITHASKVAGICFRCFDHLPKVTRELYAAGTLNVRRVGELARLRRTPYGELRRHAK